MCNLSKTGRSKFSSQTNLKWLQLSEFNNVTRICPLFKRLLSPALISAESFSSRLVQVIKWPAQVWVLQIEAFHFK
ncbi:unnamed protein product [Moneuplotes crassus]|uniref:Uncharacterized protein n=1 Tax=Euplotes crassus TaxID=5936 RepID=A0AAD1Y4U5_EUPCR|nr:unnamed protein product [Moneuplotes crassus]